MRDREIIDFLREKTGRDVRVVFSYQLGKFIDYMYIGADNVGHTDTYFYK